MTTGNPNRRDFLRRASRSAGALAAAYFVPSTVFGEEAPSNRITLASIGVGNRGSGVMKGFAAHPDVQFLAVCDPFGGRREAAKADLNAQYGGGETVKAYADFREVLARDDIDAVVICTQDHWHVPIAIAAARAGKDMYVEKPLGVSIRWAKVLRREVRRHGSVFQYGTQQRSSSTFRFACELARNRHIGDLKRIEAWCPDISEQYEAFHVKQYGSTEPVPAPEDLDYDLWIGPAPMAPYTVDRCTCFGAYHIYDYALGFIAGWGAHPLDIAQWGKGADDTSPVHYEGTGEIPREGLYDTISSWDVQCEYADGLPMRFMGHRVAQPVVTKYRPWISHGTTFFGTDGWVSVDRGGIYASDPKLLEVKLGPNDVHLPVSPGQDRNFLDCIRTRAATVNPLESAIRSDTISHMGNICIRLGRPIRWDPDRERIVGDDAATRMLDRPLRSPWRI
jgi:hypothetical protein